MIISGHGGGDEIAVDVSEKIKEEEEEEEEEIYINKVKQTGDLEVYILRSTPMTRY